MNLLLDTHAFYWLAEGDVALSPAASAAIMDTSNVTFLSAVSGWEIMTKATLRPPQFSHVASHFTAIYQNLRLRPLAISMEHAMLGPRLPWYHKDPFDRLLIAQAMIDGMTIVTRDTVFPQYGVNLLW